MKFNEHDGIKEPRIIAVTSEYGLINIKEEEMQRTIRCRTLHGFSKSKDPTNLQFVVHINDEYEYRYEMKTAQLRDELFNVVAETASKKNLPKIKIYAIPKDRSLKEFTTNKKAFMSGKSNRPPPDMEEEANKIADKPTDQEESKEESKEEKKADQAETPGQSKASHTLDSFEIKSVLGDGSFAVVYMMEKKATGDVFAVKAVNMATVIDYSLQKGFETEKQILNNYRGCPFVVTGQGFFKTNTHMFFMEDFLQGGDLFSEL